jgi:hypothetical protein
MGLLYKAVDIPAADSCPEWGTFSNTGQKHNSARRFTEITATPPDSAAA